MIELCKVVNSCDMIAGDIYLFAVTSNGLVRLYGEPAMP